MLSLFPYRTEVENSFGQWPEVEKYINVKTYGRKLKID